MGKPLHFDTSAHTAALVLPRLLFDTTVTHDRWCVLLDCCVQVVVTNVKLLYTPKPTPPAEEPAQPAEPAAAAAADNTTAPAAADNTTALAKPAANETKAAPKAPAAKEALAANATQSAKAKPEAAPLRKLLRALFAEQEEASAEPAPKAADKTNITDKAPAKEEKKPSLDAAAIVEELPGMWEAAWFEQSILHGHGLTRAICPQG